MYSDSFVMRLPYPDEQFPCLHMLRRNAIFPCPLYARWIGVWGSVHSILFQLARLDSYQTR